MACNVYRSRQYLADAVSVHAQEIATLVWQVPRSNYKRVGAIWYEFEYQDFCSKDHRPLTSTDVFAAKSRNNQISTAKYSFYNYKQVYANQPPKQYQTTQGMPSHAWGQYNQP